MRTGLPQVSQRQALAAVVAVIALFAGAIYLLCALVSWCNEGPSVASVATQPPPAPPAPIGLTAHALRADKCLFHRRAACLKAFGKPAVTMWQWEHEGDTSTKDFWQEGETQLYVDYDRHSKHATAIRIEVAHAGGDALKHEAEITQWLSLDGLNIVHDGSIPIYLGLGVPQHLEGADADNFIAQTAGLVHGKR